MAFLVPIFTAIGSAVGSVTSAIGGVVGSVGSVGTTLAVGSTLLGAAGALQQGRAAKDAANYNARVNEMQARAAQDQGVARATEQAARNKQKLAASRAGILQSGLELTGSMDEVLDAASRQGQLDMMTSSYEANSRAEQLRQSADAERARGKNAMTASYIGAGSNLLSGFSKLYIS